MYSMFQIDCFHDDSCLSVVDDDGTEDAGVDIDVDPPAPTTTVAGVDGSDGS